MRGVFVSVEGCEGSGKSTLAARVASQLKERSFASILTREPGGTPLGEKIRSLLLWDPHVGAIDARAELLLFLASRAEHIARVIEPALQRGEIVVCDRYIDSTIAYQAFGRGLDPEEILSLSRMACPLMPDYTVCLDISYEISKQRMAHRQGEIKDKMEAESQAFHERVRQGFLSLSHANPYRIQLFDGSRSVDELSMIAVMHIQELLEQKKQFI